MKPNLLAVTLAVLVVMIASAAPAGPALTQGTVPSLSARDLGGKTFDLETSLADGPVIVTFWATWCRPCRKELPELKLLDAYGDRGLRVVAVNGDGPVDQAKIRPYVRAHGFDFVVLPDPDGRIRRRFQVEVFPTTFLVDEAGRILHRQVGYRHGDEEILKTALEDHLAADAPPPEPAPDGNESAP